MKIATTLAAFGLAAIATTASAETAATSQSRSGSAPTTAPAPSAETKYCITYERTVGSRLDRQECKTKRQWAKEDVNVDQLLAK